MQSKFLLLTLGVMVLVFSMTPTAYAALPAVFGNNIVIDSDPDNNTNNHAALLQNLGSGFTGTFSGVQLQVAINPGDTNYRSPVDILQVQIVGTTTGPFVSLQQLNGTGNDVCFFHQSNVPVTTVGFVDVSDSPCTLNSNEYYALYIIPGDNGANPATRSGRYWKGSSAGFAGQKLLIGYSTSSFNAFSTSTNAVSFVLFDASTGFQNISFVPTPQDIGVDTGTTSSLASLCAGSFATTSGLVAEFTSGVANGLCLVGGFLFVPSLQSWNQFTSLASTTESRFPISWFMSVRSLLGGISTTSSANYPTAQFDFSAITSSSTVPQAEKNVLPASLVLYSASSVQALVPDGTWATLRAILEALLWFAFMYFIYGKIMGLWHERIS